MISIAIDGPGGAGKSTLARRLAGELDFIYVDTGAMYRAIGLYALRAGVSTKDEEAVAALLPKIRLELRYVDGAQVILLNGEDVSSAIRAEEVSMAASNVGAHPPVRAFLLQTQRDMAKTSNVLMDGRDIGTAVLPDATLKIYLTAPAEVRAARRVAQLAEKGTVADFAGVLEDINRRDWQDMHRDIAPLRQAEDAVLVDTGDLNLEDSFLALRNLIRERTGV
ncbi:MAG: (d)CMP kinase [Oscillospiraceae bacterium]|nr:(d)CMP kinase [Oscillospiraceae bacterium]